LPTRHHKSIPEPWFSFLRELNSAVHEEVCLHGMGGFVIILVYGFSRPTGDLDVLEIAPKEIGRSMLTLGMRGGPLRKKQEPIRCRVPYIPIFNKSGTEEQMLLVAADDQASARIAVGLA
jgi:hypothetical protein